MRKVFVNMLNASSIYFLFDMGFDGWLVGALFKRLPKTYINYIRTHKKDGNCIHEYK